MAGNHVNHNIIISLIGFAMSFQVVLNPLINIMYKIVPLSITAANRIKSNILKEIPRYTALILVDIIIRMTRLPTSQTLILSLPRIRIFGTL